MIKREIVFKGYEGKAKHYKVLGRNVFVSFDDGACKKPYVVNIETGVGTDSYFYIKLESEEKFLRKIVKIIKRDVKALKRREKKERPLKIVHEIQKATWEAEYQAYLDEQDRIILKED